jgi:mono/diheme cytochrome c family protein
MAKRKKETKKPVIKKEESSERKVLIAIGAVIVIAVAYTQFFSNGNSTPTAVVRGEQLYNAYCVACHGVNGVGENPQDIYAQDEFGYVGPPMDSSAHAWHHTDEQLVNTILEGSSRNERMAAWKNVLTEEDAGDIVEYIKSLWTPFIRENCQGPSHMNPECGGHIS